MLEKKGWPPEADELIDLQCQGEVEGWLVRDRMPAEVLTNFPIYGRCQRGHWDTRSYRHLIQPARRAE